MDYAQEVEARAFVRTDAVNEAILRGDSDVQRFYSNSVVFITGGSGFLGKQLIEKLFRSCKLLKMYMLIRAKKEKNIQQRLDDIFKEPVFDQLRKLVPDFESKIVPVAGDVSEIRLGLKDEDWKTLTKEVNVIMHVAATTRFDETIRVATLINVRGTREALALGRACRNLKSYIHVSTAYTHATVKTIGNEVEEVFYGTPIPPETLISMVETMEPERLAGITPEMIKDWPNTYSFTKAVAEELVRKTSVGLPICIVRPGIVLCSYSEPSPGWLDFSCVYGATGFVVGSGLGLVHSMHVNNPTTLGLVPCDMVNNAIIVAGRETATTQSKGGDDARIYTVSTNNHNPISIRRINGELVTAGHKLSTPSAIYYSFTYGTNYKLVYIVLSIFMHFVPAYIADFVCLLIGKRRRFAKTVQKLYNMNEVLSFYMIHDWKFIDNNLVKLFNSLSEDDKTIFNFDVTIIDLTEYVLLWCIGSRKYIIKDGLKGTNRAIRKQRALRIVHYVVMSLYLYSIWKLICFAFYVGCSMFQ